MHTRKRTKLTVLYGLFGATALFLAEGNVHAGSAAWLSSPPTNNWGDPNNWSPTTVPNAPSDTATFGHSLTTHVFVSADTYIDSVTFPSSLFPSAYTITITPSDASSAYPVLIISGGGIVNNSGVRQNFINEVSSGGGNGRIHFTNTATAGNLTNFTNSAGVRSNVAPYTAFLDEASAGSATITNNGATIPGAAGGQVLFNNKASAGSATLIATGGTNNGNGGQIIFASDSTGNTARIEVFGTGRLDVSNHLAPAVTVGSIEGDGSIWLAANNLSVGSNSKSTVFSGAIDGFGGSLTKIGNGRLTLSSQNYYTGSTTVSKGSLSIKNSTGSATGTGPVQVNAGTLQGTGKIDGAVTIGTGMGTTSKATLLAGNGASRPGTLTINNPVVFQSDSTYKCVLNRNAGTASKLTAVGVTVNSSAQFVFSESGTGTLTVGTVFRVIENTSNAPISGRFRNLSNGLVLTSSDGTKFKVNYTGGTGNDLTLKVVP
jgi:autotransporter-associated beta strand protein